MTNNNLDAKSGNDSATSDTAVTALSKLPDAQVFSRDPEDYTTETIEDTITRLRKIILRQRKARQDEAEVAELTAKIKKANKAAGKKKAKDLLEQKI